MVHLTLELCLRVTLLMVQVRVRGRVRLGIMPVGRYVY